MTKKHCRCDFQVEALPLVLRLVSLWKEEEEEEEEEEAWSLSFLYQSVDMMLGAMLAVWDFKHTRHT